MNTGVVGLLKNIQIPGGAELARGGTTPVVRNNTGSAVSQRQGWAAALAAFSLFRMRVVASGDATLRVAPSLRGAKDVVATPVAANQEFVVAGATTLRQNETAQANPGLTTPAAANQEFVVAGATTLRQNEPAQASPDLATPAAANQDRVPGGHMSVLELLGERRVLYGLLGAAATTCSDQCCPAPESADQMPAAQGDRQPDSPRDEHDIEAPCSGEKDGLGEPIHRDVTTPVATSPEPVMAQATTLPGSVTGIAPSLLWTDPHRIPADPRVSDKHIPASNMPLGAQDKLVSPGVSDTAPGQVPSVEVSSDALDYTAAPGARILIGRTYPSRRSIAAPVATDRESALTGVTRLGQDDTSQAGRDGATAEAINNPVKVASSHERSGAVLGAPSRFEGRLVAPGDATLRDAPSLPGVKHTVAAPVATDRESALTWVTRLGQDGTSQAGRDGATAEAINNPVEVASSHERSGAVLGAPSPFEGRLVAPGDATLRDAPSLPGVKHTVATPVATDREFVMSGFTTPRQRVRVPMQANLDPWVISEAAQRLPADDPEIAARLKAYLDFERTGHMLAKPAAWADVDGNDALARGVVPDRGGRPDNVSNTADNAPAVVDVEGRPADSQSSVGAEGRASLGTSLVGTPGGTPSGNNSDGESGEKGGWVSDPDGKATAWHSAAPRKEDQAQPYARESAPVPQIRVAQPGNAKEALDARVDKVFTSVMDRIESNDFDRGRARFEIETGDGATIRVRLTVENNLVNARIDAPTEHVRDLLAGHAWQLNHRLQNGGLIPGDIEFNLAGGREETSSQAGQADVAARFGDHITDDQGTNLTMVESQVYAFESWA